MKEISIKLGKRIAELRLSKGISQEKLADMSNISRTYMGSIERGEKNITFIYLYKILTSLGIDFDTFFKGFNN